MLNFKTNNLLHELVLCYIFSFLYRTQRDVSDTLAGTDNKHGYFPVSFSKCRVCLNPGSRLQQLATHQCQRAHWQVLWLFCINNTSLMLRLHEYMCSYDLSDFK